MAGRAGEPSTDGKLDEYRCGRDLRGGRSAWLLVNKADERAGGDRVRTGPKSVRSGRTIDEMGKSR